MAGLPTLRAHFMKYLSAEFADTLIGVTRDWLLAEIGEAVPPEVMGKIPGQRPWPQPAKKSHKAAKKPPQKHLESKHPGTGIKKSSLADTPFIDKRPVPLNVRIERRASSGVEPWAYVLLTSSGKELGRRSRQKPLLEKIAKKGWTLQP